VIELGVVELDGLRGRFQRLNDRREQRGEAREGECKGSLHGCSLVRTLRSRTAGSVRTEHANGLASRIADAITNVYTS
jgi:hypothetical protein